MIVVIINTTSITLFRLLTLIVTGILSLKYLMLLSLLLKNRDTEIMSEVPYIEKIRLVSIYHTFLTASAVPIAMSVLASSDPEQAIRMMEDHYQRNLPIYQSGYAAEPDGNELARLTTEMNLPSGEKKLFTDVIKAFVLLKHSHLEFTIQPDQSSSAWERLAGSLGYSLLIVSYFKSLGSVLLSHITKHALLSQESEELVGRFDSLTEELSVKVWAYFGRPALKVYIDVTKEALQSARDVGTLLDLKDPKLSAGIEISCLVTLIEWLTGDDIESNTSIKTWLVQRFDDPPFLATHCFPANLMYGEDRCELA